MLERMFGAGFPKRRPDWLRPDGGARLELDGYAEGLAVAFEYQGPQHYGECRGRRFSPEQVAALVRRDEAKRRLCWDRGVRLVVIPDFADAFDLSGCIDQIEHAVLWAGLKIPRGWSRPAELPCLWEPLVRVFGASRLAELERIAAERGGRLLSAGAMRASDPLRWVCASGHEWRAMAGNILAGSWCRECAYLAKLQHDISGMRRLAEDRGGLCLSPEYRGSKVRLMWRCGKGHEWAARPRSVLAGAWCPDCAMAENDRRQREAAAERGYTLDGMRRVAMERGGECLSDAYVNSAVDMRWRCGEGHEWSAPAQRVVSGSWCAACTGKLPRGLTIEDMHALALRLGGDCLSHEFSGSSQKLLWRCGAGHEWRAIPAHPFKGKWCPYCRLEAHNDAQRAAAALRRAGSLAA